MLVSYCIHVRSISSIECMSDPYLLLNHIVFMSNPYLILFLCQTLILYSYQTHISYSMNVKPISHIVCMPDPYIILNADVPYFFPFSLVTSVAIFMCLGKMVIRCPTLSNFKSIYCLYLMHFSPVEANFDLCTLL